MANIKQPFLFPKLLSVGSFTLRPEKLSGKQTAILAAAVIISIAVKIYLIPFNMMDMGDSATRVWNAFWWAQKPFFVLPESGHPLWFYFMGTILKITGELYLTSAFTMIAVMTIAGIYVFKLTLTLTDYKTALLSFIIVTLNPVIFRLNFEPYAQQTYLAAACIMLYYFIKALASDKSVMYFIVAGIFSFIALASRPEAIFMIVPLCILAFLTRRNGCCYYIGLSLIFQVIWIAVSYAIYGEPFKTFNSADQYTDSINIHGLNLGLRLKGFFLPYYFIVLGLTVILFYYFIKGIIYFYRGYPKIFLITLLIPILAPALVNGAAGAKSAIYHTTHYMYLMYFIAPVLVAAGLNTDLTKIRSGILQSVVASVVILSCIPLSYVKEFVPEKYNKLFPKIIQFIVTADEPEETDKLIYFVDHYIDKYPALIFDADDNASSIFYVPYRTKLAPPEKVMISGYNIPSDKDGLTAEIKSFMKKNPKGIIMYRKNPNTIMNRVFSELTAKKPYIRNGIQLEMETEKWLVMTYEPAEGFE
ncbi:MAG: hypothetical protein HOP31_08095 [Ignavibacteria bacterium]|nr:hypothetical protein [Ignavibacteria bacterium]